MTQRQILRTLRQMKKQHELLEKKFDK